MPHPLHRAPVRSTLKHTHRLRGTRGREVWVGRCACLKKSRTTDEIKSQLAANRANAQKKYGADRAYQRASKELQERRKQRLKVEIGFVSQKRAERQEERRDADENCRTPSICHRVCRTEARMRNHPNQHAKSILRQPRNPNRTIRQGQMGA
jgi:hypothetical protein